jgi:hypothetical protein
MSLFSHDVFFSYVHKGTRSLRKTIWYQSMLAYRGIVDV